ncbi:MAG TPA: YfhO family protein [Verrucomicrobiae bacterium]|nr:YfhO family protein [Verrucomicrobiae bacterium]
MESIGGRARGRFRAFLWAALLIGVIAWFFHETIFQRCSLVPMDLLDSLVTPFNAGSTHVDVQNHYTFDVAKQDYPWGLFWQQSVRAGRIPLWNPYICGGHPYLAASHQAALSPFKILYLFMSAERALSLGVVLEFVLGGIWMFALLRELERSRCAAFLGGCAYALNSAFVMWYWREPSTLVWAPLVLLLFERSARLNSWPYSLAAGIVLGVAFISGSIQAASHIGLLCVGYFIFSLPWNDPIRRNQLLLRSAVVYLVGVLVASAQWLPTLELLTSEGGGKYVQTAGATPVGIKHLLLGPPLMITFLFPALAGSPESYDVLKVIGATMGDFTGYIGAVPFTLAVVGAVLIRDRRARGLLGVAVCVLAIVFLTPLVKYLYHRVFIVFVFAMAALAAYGADALVASLNEDLRKIRRTLTVMLGLCLLVACGLAVVQCLVHFRRDELVSAGRRYVLSHAGGSAFASCTGWLEARVPLFLDHFRLSNVVFWLPLTSICAVAAFWNEYARRRISRAVLWIVVIGFSVADLTVLGRGWLPQVNLAKHPLFPPLRILAPVQADSGLFRVYQWANKGDLFLPNNILMVYGLPTLGGYESLSPRAVPSLPNRTHDEFNRLLDLQNVKYVVTDPSVSLPADRFKLRAEDDGVRLYLNKTCLPRLQFIPRWDVEPDHKRVLDRMTAGRFDPGATVFIEREAPVAAPGPSESTQRADVEVKQYGAQRIVVDVRCEQDGFLVLSDTFYPGWRARRNGQDTMLYRADYVLRAVFVPPGESEVEFYYAPLSFRVGAGISLGTVICVTVVGFWLALRRRPRA